MQCRQAGTHARQRKSRAFGCSAGRYSRLFLLLHTLYSLGFLLLVSQTNGSRHRAVIFGILLSFFQKSLHKTRALSRRGSFCFYWRYWRGGVRVSTAGGVVCDNMRVR